MGKKTRVKQENVIVPQGDKYKLLLNKVNFTKKQKDLLKIAFHPDTKVVFVSGPAGTAKAQPLDAVVYTPQGPKTMGEIRRGDYVLSEKGKPTRVLGVFPQGSKRVLKVSFSDGSFTRCCEDHLWLTQTSAERNNKVEKNETEEQGVGSDALEGSGVRTTLEIMNSLVAGDGQEPNHSIQITHPVEFEKRELPIDPYILGCLLGGGGITKDVNIPITDEEIINYFKSNLPDNNFKFDGEATYLISCPDLNEDSLKERIKQLGLNKRHELKFIPDIYKYSSIGDRLSLLQGLMDISGFNPGDGSCFFEPYSETLKKDLVEVVQSLGGVCENQKCDTSCSTECARGLCAFGVKIYLPNDMSPFTLKRKMEGMEPKAQPLPIRYITDIEYLEDGECKCILVDNESHLYLTDNFIVTHNTFISVYAALQLFNMDYEKNILYVRTTAESAERSLGFLKGGEHDKFEPFMTPLMDKLEELLPPDQSKMLMAEGIVDATPINFLRGANWKDKIVIMDECISEKHFVFTDRGNIRISKLYDMYINGRPLPKALSFNEENRDYEYKQITGAAFKGVKETVVVKAKGKKFYCTPDHKFYTTQGWVEAKDLTPLTTPIITSRGTILPESINFHGKEEKVYDIEVQDNHNFFIGTRWSKEGALVHNCQNASFKELQTFLTRIAEGTKVFICGDVMQSDIGRKSGFSEVIEMFDDVESASHGIYHIKFDRDDIMRSEIVKFIVGRFEEKMS